MEKKKVYKEYKKEICQEHITNAGSSWTDNFKEFLKRNQGIKILHIIKHQPYQITIVYEKMVEITPPKRNN
jgi:hypothetical protein